MKATKATFKAWLKKLSIDNLSIKTTYSHNEDTGANRHQFTACKKTNNAPEHTLGITGVWLVGHGGDYFKKIVNGFEVQNCCVCFEIIEAMAVQA